MKDFNLKERRKRLGETVREMAGKISISQPVLTRIENGEWPTDFNVLVKVIEAYRLPAEPVERAWLFRQAHTPSAKDHLSTLLSQTPEDTKTKMDFGLYAQFESLTADKWLAWLARQLLTNLSEYQRRRHVMPSQSGGSIVLHDQVVESDFSLFEGGRFVKRKEVFVTSRPARFLAELHWFPPNVGAHHRQPVTGVTKPGIETFSVTKGTAILLRHDRDGWRSDTLVRGDCGYYSGGEDHVWLNPLVDEPLILFQCFFPLCAEKPMPKVVAADGSIQMLPGAAVEFMTSHFPPELASEVRVEVELALTKWLSQR